MKKKKIDKLSDMKDHRKFKENEKIIFAQKFKKFFQ